MLKLFRKIHQESNGHEEVGEEIISPEVIAVLCSAIECVLSEEDRKKHILTIKRLPKSYSPWSSKIYMLRQVPNQYYKR